MEIDAVLGAPYESRRFALPPDFEGEVVATLVRRRAPGPTDKAVLYLHGYVDYFFQRHLAEFFTARGFDFYALELRKYGRSLLPHQTPNYCGDLTEYYPEVDEAVRIIRCIDGHRTLLLDGHSTGGLIAALWAHRTRGSGLVQGVFLNSPFFDFNENWVTRHIFAPVINAIARVRPLWKLPQELGTTYGLAIHGAHLGEWDYDLAWKPLNGFPIYAGWTRAISRGQRRLRRGLGIDVPILVACSARSYGGKDPAKARDADAVLNVRDMVRYAPRLGPDVTIAQIEGGMHDLTLSEKPARGLLFAALDGWLAAKLPLAHPTEPDPSKPQDHGS